MERRPARVRAVLPDLTDLTAVTLYILLACWVSARFWKDLTRLTPARPADHADTEWLLAHTAHALRHLTNPLAGLPDQIPGAGALIPQASALGITLPLAPVTMWLGPGAAYALWLTLALAVTGVSAYWVLSRHLVRSRLAAFVGAGVFAFAPAMMWHSNGQPHFVTNFLVPLIVLGTLKLVGGRPVRHEVPLGLLLAWQALISTEVLLLTALGGGVAALCFQFQREGRARPSWAAARPVVAGLAVALGTALVLLAYPIWYRLAGDPAHHTVPKPVARDGEDLTAFVQFWRDSLAGNFTAARSIGSIEQNTWFGWPAVILAGVCVALLWRQSLTTRVVTLTAAVFGVLSLGSVIRANGGPTGIPGPWWPFSKLPGFDLVAPTHLALVLTPCLAVLLAIACDRLPKWDNEVSYGLSFRRIFVVLVAAALVAAAPKPLQANGNLGDLPAFITAGTWRQYVTAGQTVVPVPSSAAAVDARVQQAATLLELTLPEPYRGGADAAGLTTAIKGRSPTAELLRSVAQTGHAPDVITEKTVLEAYAELRSWNASVLVLVAGGRLEDLMRETVTHLIGRFPTLIDGAWVWDVREIVKAGGPA